MTDQFPFNLADIKKGKKKSNVKQLIFSFRKRQTFSQDHQIYLIKYIERKPKESLTYFHCICSDSVVICGMVGVIYRVIWVAFSRTLIPEYLIINIDKIRAKVILDPLRSAYTTYLALMFMNTYSGCRRLIFAHHILTSCMTLFTR